MNQKHSPPITAFLLAWALLLPTLGLGQSPGKTVSSSAAAVATDVVSYADYLIEVTGTRTGQSYAREAASIERVLSSTAAKNAVLIDNHGYARELVLQS